MQTQPDGSTAQAGTSPWRAMHRMQNRTVKLCKFGTAQDPACNNKLLALCGAGMLSSIATLIHDTYLPVYLQDVLGLSNTRVSSMLLERESGLHQPQPLSLN